MGQTRRFDAVQRQLAKTEFDDLAQRVGHIASIGVRLTNPISQRAALGDAAAYVRKTDAAEQSIVIIAKDKKTMSDIVAPFGSVAIEAAKKRLAGQGIGGPRRFPRLEELATARAHFDIGAPIALGGCPQIDVIATEPNVTRRRGKISKQTHGSNGFSGATRQAAAR